jgi:hypothetical protein
MTIKKTIIVLLAASCIATAVQKESAKISTFYTPDGKKRFAELIYVKNDTVHLAIYGVDKSKYVRAFPKHLFERIKLATGTILDLNRSEYDPNIPEEWQDLIDSSAESTATATVPDPSKVSVAAEVTTPAVKVEDKNKADEKVKADEKAKADAKVKADEKAKADEIVKMGAKSKKDSEATADKKAETDAKVKSDEKSKSEKKAKDKK